MTITLKFMKTTQQQNTIKSNNNMNIIEYFTIKGDFVSIEKHNDINDGRIGFAVYDMMNEKTPSDVRRKYQHVPIEILNTMQEAIDFCKENMLMIGKICNYSREELGVIDEKEKFYGYIVGLELSPRIDCIHKDANMKHVFYATFNHRNTTKVYEFSDYELFKILAEYLHGNAHERSECSGYDCNKLYIKKENGKWHAELP